MDRYETVELRYEQTEDLDRQLYTLMRRGWVPVLTRGFSSDGGVFSELITFKVYED